MNSQLYYMIAQQHSAERRRDAEQARLASDAHARRRQSPRPSLISRWTSEPTHGRSRTTPALEAATAIGSER
jgi:hypothetical protein